MEDCGDDDYGDLYADVEVEASSAMSAAASQLKCVIDETGSMNPGIIAAINDVESSEDDDDDDLDIVLNRVDDDSVRLGEGSTIARNTSNLGNRELNDEDDENWGTEQSMGVKSSVNNLHSMYKYLRPQSTAYASDLKRNGCVAAAYFSREDHGYCQRTGPLSMAPQNGQRFSLPWSRNILDVNIDIFEQKPWKHPGADITDYFNFGFNEDSWKLYCNQVDEYRHEGPMSSETPLVEHAHSTERKGRPIQVENSIVERQSSIDVRGQLDRDSDVIEITILDPEEHLDSCVAEASKVGDVIGEDVMDHLSFSNASEDESVEGDQVEMDIYAPKRSSSSKPVRRGSENHESHLISDCSGRTDEAIRNSDNTKKFMLVAESSDAEKRHAYHCKREPGENRYHPMHTRPVYNNRNHRDFKHKPLDDNDESHSRKLADHRYHSRSNSPVYNNRTHRYFKPNPCHENEIRKPLENRYARQSKAHHEYDDSFPMSDIEGTYDVHSMFSCNRQNERLHAFDPYNERGKSYLKSELPSDYNGKRFSGYEDWDTLARDLHHEGFERYGGKMDRSDFRSPEEEEYYGDRRYIEDNRMMEGDWGLNGRELAVENVDFGWKNSKYPPYLKYKRGTPWKKKGDSMHFRNYGEDDEFCQEREFSDDILGAKYATVSCNGRERDDIERRYVKHLEYTKWEFRGPGRNERRVSSPSSELNNPLLKKAEERVLSYMEDYSFPSRSSEESHIINGRWDGNMIPRNSLDGRHGRYKDQWSQKLGYDGSLGDYSESFDREHYKLYIEGHVDMGRKRHWQSEMQWEEDEVVLRHGDAKFCVDRTSLPFENVSRHKRFVSEHEPNNVEESIDDPHVERHKFKPRRKGKYERTSDFTCGGRHGWSFLGGVDIPDSRVVDGYDHVEESTADPHAKGRIRYKQTKKIFLGNKCSETYRESRERISLRCKNSLHSNLVVGEVKSSEKPEKPEWMDFSSCQSDRMAQAVKTNVHDAGLDIEEGQVLTEEIKMVPLKIETSTLVNDVKKLHNKNGKTGVYDPRILEAMAKMEKRRARFNEPISTTKKDSDSTGKLTVVDSVQETTSNKQQKPARKRRWGGS